MSAKSKLSQGSKTSEFWMVLVVIVVNMMNSKWGLGLTELQLAGMDATAMSYVWGRSSVKKAG